MYQPWHVAAGTRLQVPGKAHRGELHLKDLKGSAVYTDKLAQETWEDTEPRYIVVGDSTVQSLPLNQRIELHRVELTMSIFSTPGGSMTRGTTRSSAWGGRLHAFLESKEGLFGGL